MAYQETGAFLLSESSFRTPGAYGVFLAAEGKTKANYLAQMDMFFEQLKESTRQFNETLGFKEEELSFSKEKWGEELAQRKTEFDSTLAYNKWLAEQNLGETKASREQALELGTRELDIRERSVEKSGGGKTEYINPLAASYAQSAAEANLTRLRGLNSTLATAPKSGEVTGGEASAARATSGLVQSGETWDWIDDPNAQY